MFNNTQNLTYINEILSIIVIMTTSFSLTSWSLNNNKLSEIKYINYIQKISIILFIIYILLNIYIYNIENIIYGLDNENNNNNNDSIKEYHGHGHIHTSINMNSDTANIIGSSIDSISSNWGLGGATTGVAIAVSQAIAKSSMPPIFKVVSVCTGAFIGGSVYGFMYSITRMNKNYNNTNSVIESTKNIKKFIENTDTISLFELSLSYLYDIIYFQLILFILIAINLFIKVYINDNPELLWLNKFFSSETVISLKKYIHKYIKINKQLNSIYIIYSVIMMIIGFIGSLYGVSSLYNNLDKYIELYINYKNNK